MPLHPWQRMLLTMKVRMTFKLLLSKGKWQQLVCLQHKVPALSSSSDIAIKSALSQGPAKLILNKY